MSSAERVSSSTSTAGRGEDRAGQREPLPLAAGQAHALLADPGVEAERQLVDELRLRDLDGLGDAPRRCASGRPSAMFSRADIENSTGSSNAVATSSRSRSRRRSRTSTPSRVMRPPVTSQSRATRLVKIVLPEPVAPDEGDGLARRQVQVDVVQDVGVGVGEAEGDVLEGQLAADVVELARRRRRW